MKNILKLIMVIGTFYVSNAVWSQLPSYVPLSKLGGWWSFTGNYNDQSFNGNHGVNNSTSFTYDRFSNINSAIKISSSGRYVSVSSPINGELDPDTGSLTISIWIKGSSPDFLSLISKWAVDGAGYALQRTNRDGFQFTIKDSFGVQTQIRTKEGICSDSNWHHVVAIRDVSKDSIFIHVDGTQVASTKDLSNSPVNNVERLTIGSTGGISWTLSGELDDIGYWNRSLTKDEISSLYNAQNHNVGIEEIVKEEKQLIKITDLSGRETEVRQNTVLVYTYSDGTREKKLIVE